MLLAVIIVATVLDFNFFRCFYHIKFVIFIAYS